MVALATDLSASSPTFEQSWTNRLQSYYLLHDDELAMSAAEEAVAACPHAFNVYLSAMRIYVRAKNETKMLQLWHTYQRHFPNKPYPRDLLEEMSWGFIQKSVDATAPITRAMALIAAAMGNDAKGVDILDRRLADPHRGVRMLAVEFASKFRDSKLQESVIKRLQEEKDYEVRLGLLSAVGCMKIKDAKPMLMRILESERTTAEEKAAAMVSLVDLYDNIDRKEIERFIKHPQAALRAMACALIRHNDRLEDCDLLLPLLNDGNAEVRKAALETLGEMRAAFVNQSSIKNWVQPLTCDRCPEVAMTAAWVLMLHAPQEGQEALKPWLKSEIAKERLYAAAVLAGSGKYGFPLTLQTFRDATDTSVKINLGLVLIQQGIETDAGAEALLLGITQKNKRWMTKPFGRFEAIAPCDVDHRADIANYPEVVNQTTRLELLNQLALLHHPSAQQAIKSYLSERPWGISGAASALLLTEGDEEALSLIRNLLHDPREKIRLQVALILGLWGSDPEALSTLQTLYPTVSRSKKEQILESLGRIGDQSALPFLVQCLEESYPSLRIIAATAILQTLYH